MNYFSKNLTYCRKKFSVTQTELAFQLNKGQTTVGGWEKGVSEPGIEILIHISEFFGIPIDHFLKTDLENGNLITDQHVKDFREKGNLIGKPISNLKSVYVGFKEGHERLKSVPHDTETDRDWVLARMIQENARKLDQLLLLAQKGVENKR